MNMLRLSANLFLILIGIAAIGTAAAQGQRAPHAPGDRIEITSISPPISAGLTAGQKVRVAVQFTYAVSVSGGLIALLAQTPSPEYSPLARAELQLNDKSGVGKLSVEFVVPRTRTVTIYLPLYADPERNTSTVDSRVYEVNLK